MGESAMLRAAKMKGFVAFLELVLQPRAHKAAVHEAVNGRDRGTHFDVRSVVVIVADNRLVVVVVDYVEAGIGISRRRGLKVPICELDLGAVSVETVAGDGNAVQKGLDADC